MTTMKAIRHIGLHTFPELKDIDRPTPAPTEVLLKVAGSGACHSDVAIFDEFGESSPAVYHREFTLGHEVTGWVEEVGSAVEGFEKGDAYLVYGPLGCGRCSMCVRGDMLQCRNRAANTPAGIGLGRDGGMAEYVTVPARNLVPLGDADPIAASALADAGLTPYHAIKKALPTLNQGGQYVLVIGLGGLGLLGIQILKAMTSATIIATDTKESALNEAERLGAVTVASDDDVVDNILAATGGRGIDAAFDFVGLGQTVSTAMATVGPDSRVTVVGLGNGSPYEFAWLTSPRETELISTYWGTLPELHELVELFRDGYLEPMYTTYPLSEGLEAYRKLQAGQVSGRAVIVPHGSA